MAPSVVLFDLDGTLSDSAPGILAALRYAFAANGIEPLDAHTERTLLGPPFYESLPPLIGPEKVPAVIAAYRQQYGEGGMFDTKVYDGIADVLEYLHGCGVTLAVATSKPEPYAVPIVEHLELARYFALNDLQGAQVDLGAHRRLKIGEIVSWESDRHRGETFISEGRGVPSACLSVAPNRDR